MIAYSQGQRGTCTRNLLLDGHKIYCISPLLLHIAAENNVTIILPSHCTHTLQSKDKCFCGHISKTKPQFLKSLNVTSYVLLGLVGVKAFMKVVLSQRLYIL